MECSGYFRPNVRMFSKIHDPVQNSRHQKGDKREVPYWGPTIPNLSSWFQTFAVSWMLYAFFRVIPQHLNFICGRFGTHCSVFTVILHASTCLWRWNRQCVLKRRHIKFRHRGITQKKAYNKFKLLGWPVAQDLCTPVSDQLLLIEFDYMK